MIWIIVFFIVLLINLIPIFMPPTWLVLSFVAVSFQLSNIFLLALIGAAAATIGRSILALVSNRIIRKKILPERYRVNIDDLSKHLENKKALTASIFLFYALSPLPSGQLFIAYGLTKLSLNHIIPAFFIGRVASYFALAYTSLEISERVALESLKTASFLSISFIFSQVLLLFVIYVFIKIDWHKLFTEKKIRIRK